jgi:hypothetical protein
MNGTETEQPQFVCGNCGKVAVSGIWCDPCRALVGESAPRRPMIATGETVRFVWHGVERVGTVEKVGRTRIKVLIEYGEKRKALTVAVADLLNGNGDAP